MPSLSQWKTAYARLRGRRWFGWAVDAVLISAVLFGIAAWQSRGHVRGATPPFSLPALGSGGATFSSQALRGKPALVVFWAPWCGVCGAESDNISRVRRWTEGRAQVVSVASSFQSVREVEAYVRRHQVDYPVLLDDQGVAQAYRVSGFPTVYFLDEDGKVKGSAVGYATTLGLLFRLWW